MVRSAGASPLIRFGKSTFRYWMIWWMVGNGKNRVTFLALLSAILKSRYSSLWVWGKKLNSRCLATCIDTRCSACWWSICSTRRSSSSCGSGTSCWLAPRSARSSTGSIFPSSRAGTYHSFKSIEARCFPDFGFAFWESRARGFVFCGKSRRLCAADWASNKTRREGKEKQGERKALARKHYSQRHPDKTRKCLHRGAPQRPCEEHPNRD